MNKQTRREFLRRASQSAVTAGVLSVLPSCKSLGNGTGKKGKRPNVILVITDDQGYGDLGCHGNPVIKTPNLDRLHSQSVRLTDFHVDPTCSPTRSALMTGHYSTRTGVWHTIMGRSLLGKHEVTMADVFSASGYRTGIFGKWHLGDNYPFRPQDRGFDEVLIHGGGGVGQGPDYWGNDYFDDTYLHNGKWKKFSGYCTNVWFDGAMKFIEDNKDKPFFCYLTTNAPHGPYNVAEKYEKMYEGNKDIPNAAFYGMITNIDENMGRLMKKLEAMELEKDTVLIFMTDNGTAAGFRRGVGFNAGMKGTKGSEYDGGHRVPCFIRWPGGGLEGGKDVDRLTAHIDLLPTLIGLCGLKKPKNLVFDGTSLVPLLKNQSVIWPERTLLVHSQRIEYPQKWRKSAVMTEQWRLVNGKELYDIKADPGQGNNIADEKPKVVEKLRDAYEKWWADLSKGFDDYCETIIGSDKENPVRLMSHDWHTPRVPWHQGAVRSGMQVNGFWAVEVARDGRYEVSLRRWPLEVDKPIMAAIAKGKAINVTKARLKIADLDVSKPVSADAHAVNFQVKLKAGKTQLQTWFIDDKGESRGAYYVYVKRL
ncbi:MAG: sulfatase-like hydrolase/transferase [Phycisphaerae bacterium]|nr:arylsulfatase [Phycisphaerae bacterium]NIP54994.1 arylsulfatase [Phycisphaerae bacterium]NIS53709.1 arylsulfatase [Phycisphaerae bacterium]NIU11280.1 arylsulfatase [Phycisphaerae bacterium]NIU56937.1 sulfatase-like hydrolase/transferase [Phycisphaerae bacterium]